MRLIRVADVPAPLGLQTWRHPAFPLFCLFVACLAAPVLPIAFAFKLLQHAGAGWRIFAAVMAILPMGIWLLVMVSIGESIRAAFSPDNWIMKLAGEGAYLKYRSYQNRHFSAGDPVVVYVAFNEMASAALRKETIVTTRPNRAPLRRDAKRLEVRLTHRDSEELAGALAVETAREGPDEKRGGVRMRKRTNHSPVIIPEPGVILIEWRGKSMLEALAGRVARHDGRVVEIVDRPDPGVSLDARVAQLVERGERMSAVTMVRRVLDMDLKSAKAYVEGVLARRAGGQAPS